MDSDIALQRLGGEWCEGVCVCVSVCAHGIYIYIYIYMHIQTGTRKTYANCSVLSLVVQEAPGFTGSTTLREILKGM